jgi:hypothetical protein
MKPQAALKAALDKPYLYSDDEIKKLRNKLEEINYEKQYDQWYRRTRQGFSNEDPPTIPITDAGSDTVHGVSDGSESKRHQL